MKRSIETSQEQFPKVPRVDNSLQTFIFKIDNNDSLCLFYALELMRYYSIYKRGIITEKKWRWIKEHQTTVLREKVLLLLKNTSIPLYEPEYDANEYINIVQGYWNSKYPGEYKIFIFNNYNTKPITKSDISEYQFPILLYHHDNHFEGIKTLSKFMKKRYYCLSCESCYDNKSNHSMSCASLCFGCREIGVDYPCEHQQGYFISAGCKNYGMMLQNKNTGVTEYDLKVRGFTLDVDTCKKLHYDSVKEQIMLYGTDKPPDPISITYPHFIRPNMIQGKVYTHSQTKLYQPTITKGIVNDSYQVLEFGYRKNL